MTNESERAKFEAWYVETAFDYCKDPIGSRDCSMQWAGWQARAQSSGPVVAVSELEDLIERWEEFQLSKTPDAREAMTDCAAQLRDLIAKHTGRE
jgi:hypothetical protein